MWERMFVFAWGGRVGESEESGEVMNERDRDAGVVY